MLLGPDEVQMKSKIWLEENESFLKEQEGEYHKKQHIYVALYCLCRKTAKTRSHTSCSGC